MDYNFDTKSIKQLDRYQGILSEDDLLPIYLNREENYLSDDDNDPIVLNSTKATTFGNIMQYFTPSVPQAEIQIQNLQDGQGTGSLRTLGSMEEKDGYSLGAYAFSEGERTQASGRASHAEGLGVKASNDYAHAEGWSTIASGWASHAEGAGDQDDNLIASGRSSHAEGEVTIASGIASHAEGYLTKASANYSHAEGNFTTASGASSHAQNIQTIAASTAQTAIGKYNIADNNNDYAFIVGNGTSSSSRSNANALDWQGNAYLAGDVYTNYDFEDGTVSENDKLITKGEVNSLIATPFTDITDLQTNIAYKADKSSIGYTVIGQSDSIINKNISNTSFAQLLLDFIYPIGSIYMSMNDTNPSNLFGGTWQPLAPGKMLLGADETNYITGDITKGQGGRADTVIPPHTHTIAAQSLTPESSGTVTKGALSAGSHSHTAGNATDKNNKNVSASFIEYNYGAITAGLGELRVASTSSGSHYVPYCGKSAVDFWGARTSTATAGAHIHTVKIPAHNTGSANGATSDVSKTNLPPYVVVNMWQRVAEE